MSKTLPTFSEPYTEAAAITFIEAAMDVYDRLKDLSDIGSLQTLTKTMSTSFFSFKAHRKKMCEIMLNKRYIPNTSTIMEGLSKRGYFSNDEVWFTTYYVFNTLWNFCDFDQEIATAILTTEIPRIIIANILHKPYLENLNNANSYYIMKSSISIVHNVSRFPGNQGPFNISGLKGVLQTLIKRNNSDFLGLISMLTLAVLVDETELQLLEDGKGTISSLISHIKTANSKDDKRFDGFMVWELVNGLRCIAANDIMKKTIVEDGGIEVLIDVLKNPSTDDDIEKCLGAIWNLSFNKEIRESLKKDYDIKNVIKPFEKNPSSAIRKNYEGIIWLLDNKSQSVQRVKSAAVNKQKSNKRNVEWKFDIFFSYSWANKAMVFNIRDELLKSKIKIWIDVDQMKGSTLEAMADGIENSKIFVMAVSDAYRTSPNCRTEAEYAFSLKKPIIPLIMECRYKPTSWLGIIIGSKKYYEFSERRNFLDTSRDLLKNIIDLTTDQVEEIIVPAIASQLQIDQVDSAGTSARVQSDGTVVSKWTKTDVGKWLTRSQLTNVKSKFVDIDGMLLNSMIEICVTAPEYFYQSLKTEFGMKFVDILRFKAALKDLSLA